MQIFQGIAVSPGVAIGEAFVLDNEGFRIPRRFIAADAVDDEQHRLARSVETVSKQLELYGRDVAQQLGDEYGAIFSAQLQMLRDARLQQQIRELIQERHYSAEYAVSRTLRKYAKVFQNLENKHMAERAHDIIDIEKRLLSDLLGGEREDLSRLRSQVIVLAHDLTPSETANLNPEFVRGFAAEIGGPGGHTAIVAEALEIPAVVGVGAFLNDVAGGDLLIVDGDRGRIIVQPDEATLVQYREQLSRQRNQAVQLASLRDLPAETLDGHPIELYANIEFPQRGRSVSLAERGASGHRAVPHGVPVSSAAEQEPSGGGAVSRPTSEAVRALEGRPARRSGRWTLGADKVEHSRSLPGAETTERNPFLGLRGRSGCALPQPGRLFKHAAAGDPCAPAAEGTGARSCSR
jgi:phosphoenolpyruvate-protein phosphotransferase (PTS system enzyme I)